MAKFPSTEWLQALADKLNTDPHYAQVARNWEGDMLFEVEAGDSLPEPVTFYLDLWHGACRQAYVVEEAPAPQAVFRLNGPYKHCVRLLQGELDPMQALLTRKLGVHGNMAVLMRNVPTVLDFVRCAREVTDSFV